MSKALTSRKALSADEIADHLNQDQALFVLRELANATGEGKPPRRYKFDPMRVIGRFLHNRTEDAALSLALGLGHVATRGEAATMIIARQAAMTQPKPDYGINRELAESMAADDS